MRLFLNREGALAHVNNQWFKLAGRSWDSFIARDDLFSYLTDLVAHATPVSAPRDSDLLPPIGSQEVWAAGVTYYRSRDARMEESKTAGGGSFYDRVYVADRPELFMKASPHRVVGHGQDIRIRKDSKWNVPEPELALIISPSGKIIGYTIGNDMSSRDIEGENPLYLPQAKVYDQCCGLGPCILVSPSAPAPTTSIHIRIDRDSKNVFEGRTTISEIKRPLTQLVEYLYRDNSFPTGAVLLTGTGVIPPTEFTLAVGDLVSITIDSIGTLQNRVVQRPA